MWGDTLHWEDYLEMGSRGEGGYGKVQEEEEEQIRERKKLGDQEKSQFKDGAEVEKASLVLILRSSTFLLAFPKESLRDKIS